MDGYFFLRYLRLIIFICVVGILLLYPILLPINATGGAGESGFDLLSFSNIKNHNRYYAHVFVGWVFYGCCLFLFYRELTYFTTFRSSILATPYFASQPSAKTILFQTVPKEYLNKNALLSLFPNSKRVWIARGSKKLASLVKKREKLSTKLENAESNLLSKAVKAKLANDQNEIIEQQTNDISVYVPEKKRPTHRLKPLIGKKVDTINYCRKELGKLNIEIEKLQLRAESSKPLNSAFIEFETQADAQVALQCLAHHTPLYLSPRFANVEPENVIWSNLRLFWWERDARVIGTTAAIFALVILWAVPVAFVGMISNITYLTNKLPWLKWIYNMPSELLGIITGILPTVLLSLLMMVLPMFLRLMAKISGCPTDQLIEYHVQNSYFSFQVVQVFLVTTIASSATSVVTQIIAKPTSAMTLLASNLPKSSNFFIAYMLLQGLTVPGGALLQISSLIMFHVLGFILDKTARSKFKRWTNLGTIAWGTTFPVYTNLAVIMLSYAVISPLIIVFTLLGFTLLYIVYLHNIIYVFDHAADAKGMYYPRAIYQTFTGLYLGEICMLGLFAVGKGWGPIILQAILIGVTTFFQIKIQDSVRPLLNCLPRDVLNASENSLRLVDGRSQQNEYDDNVTNEVGTSITEKHRPSVSGPFSDNHNLQTLNPDGTLSVDNKNIRALNPNSRSGTVTPELTAPNSSNSSTDSLLTSTKVPNLHDPDFELPPPKNFIIRFFLPHTYKSYPIVRSILPAIFQTPITLNIEQEENMYNYPAATATAPYLWIPRDPMGLSRIECEETGKVTNISDEGAEFDEKGKIIWTGAPPASE